MLLEILCILIYKTRLYIIYQKNEKIIIIKLLFLFLRKNSIELCSWNCDRNQVWDIWNEWELERQCHFEETENNHYPNDTI